MLDTNVSTYPCAREGCATPIRAGQIYCTRHKPKPTTHPFKAAYGEAASPRKHGQNIALPGSPIVRRVSPAACDASPTGAHWRDCTMEDGGREAQVCRYCGDRKEVQVWTLMGLEREEDAA